MGNFILKTTALTALLLVLATSVATAKTWERTDVDLLTLLEYDFSVVDTNMQLLESGTETVEVIYMIKGKKLIRCFTYEKQNQEDKHWCEALQ